ncbi:MAG: hypothetical protein ACRDMV_18180 [Streptosporangiales bacterium]
MAIRTLLWAKDQTVITQTIRQKNGRPVVSTPTPNMLDKLVLIGVGDEASEKTWQALIGVEDLAVFAGCTRRAVRESLGRLERAGFIQCRETRLETGTSGWKRIYLLADESPLVKGLIEVDFSTVEDVRRFEMRTFRDRYEGGYVPGDSRSKLTMKTAAQGQEEPRSPWQGRGNEVPPTRGNEVPPTGERGSSYEGERGSSPSFSTNFSSPSDARASGTEGKEGGTDGTTEESTEWALQLVTGLNYGQHRRPTRKQAHKLAMLVDAARASGLSEVEVKRHCRATLNGARKSGVAYLAGGLQPDNLPAPSTDMPDPRPGEDKTAAHDDEQPNSDTLDRRSAWLAIQQTLAETSKGRASHVVLSASENA